MCPEVAERAVRLRVLCERRAEFALQTRARRDAPEIGCRFSKWHEECWWAVMTNMRAAVFEQKGKISIREVPKPSPGPGECAHPSDADHHLRHRRAHLGAANTPVKNGLVIGHEPVGVVEAVGIGVTGYAPGRAG